MFERRLEQLREWWECHGGDLFESADEWINSMSNVELLEALSWFDKENSDER